MLVNVLFKSRLILSARRTSEDHEVYPPPSPHRALRPRISYFVISMEEDTSFHTLGSFLSSVPLHATFPPKQNCFGVLLGLFYLSP